MCETWLLTLGEFGEGFAIEDSQPSNQFFWAFFVMATVFNLIIMLNLLVAVISETFARVDCQQIEYAYKEKAISISTLQRLIGKCIKRDSSKQQLMFIAKKLDKSELDDDVDTLEELSEKVDMVQDMMLGMSEKIVDLKNKVSEADVGIGGNQPASTTTQLKRFMHREFAEVKSILKKTNFSATNVIKSHLSKTHKPNAKGNAPPKFVKSKAGGTDKESELAAGGGKKVVR